MMGNLGFAELLIILIVFVLIVFLIILPFWKIFGKAGFSPALSLLMLLPFVNVIMIYFLAFAEWPILRQTQK